MMRHMLSSALVLLAILSLGQTRPAATQPVDLYALTADEFFKRPDVKARIQKDTVDISLLEAAVFQQSNRERTANNLPIFKHAFALQLMARRHSAEMGDLQYFEHVSPTPENRTLADRLKTVGLVNVTAGENIAVLPAIEMGTGTFLIHKNADGSTTLTDEKTGKRLDYYTYEEIASTVLTQWMNSPTHRENLMNKKYIYLGVGAARGPYDKNHQDSFYFTQNFSATVTPTSESKARELLNTQVPTGR